MILYILLAAAHPFYHWDIRQMFENVRSGNVGFAERVWTYISDDAKVRVLLSSKNGVCRMCSPRWAGIVYYLTRGNAMA